MRHRSSRIISCNKVCRYFQVTYSGVEKFSMKDLAEISFFVSLDVTQNFFWMCQRSSRITSRKKVCRYFQVTYSGIEKFSMKDLAEISFHFVSLGVSQKFPHHFLEESLPLLSSDIQWHRKILNKRIG